MSDTPPPTAGSPVYTYLSVFVSVQLCHQFWDHGLLETLHALHQLRELAVADVARFARVEGVELAAQKIQIRAEGGAFSAPGHGEVLCRSCEVAKL